VFVIFEWGNFWRAYPPLTTDFDTTDVPARIVKTFQEDLLCQAQSCFTAAAIMVRRTLEEICADRGAKGKDLKVRIVALRNIVTLPPELFDAMDELRLLGNDAAHIEAKTYDDIGAKELEVAALFTKEILKGVYQYKSLLSALRNLKKPVVEPDSKA
jgi:Domain of unknown function (DUF4145)